jgi:hypothetical protein
MFVYDWFVLMYFDTPQVNNLFSSRDSSIDMGLVFFSRSFADMDTADGHRLVV